jgi:hypothetical protein
MPNDAIAIRYYMDELNRAQSNKKKKWKPEIISKNSLENN